MTIRENCCCGAEFYVNVFWVDGWSRDDLIKQYKMFLDAHAICRENNKKKINKDLNLLKKSK